MSYHVCETCHKQGDVRYEDGAMRASLAVCDRADCPQRQSDIIKSLFAAMPKREDPSHD